MQHLDYDSFPLQNLKPFSKCYHYSWGHDNMKHDIRIKYLISNRKHKKVKDLDNTTVGCAEPSHRAVCLGTGSRHHSSSRMVLNTTGPTANHPPRQVLSQESAQLLSSENWAQGLLFTVPPLKRRAETIGLTRKGVRNDAWGYQSPGRYATLNPTPIPFSIMGNPEFLFFSFSVAG